MGLSISASACGRCHACTCTFVCICMRMHMCVGIYMCACFCSECYMHFGTGVLGTSAWAGVYGRLCFGRSRDRGVVLYISLFLRVLGWCVCVCLYTRVHTHKLLWYLM